MSPISVGLINQAMLKVADGTWSQAVVAGAGVSINLLNYAHFPKQASDVANQLFNFPDISIFLPTSQGYFLSCQNNDTSSRTWSGTYTYHSSSERIIDLIVDKVTKKIIGIHITEKGNENSMRQFDKFGKEIDFDRYTLDESHIEDALSIADLKTKTKFQTKLIELGIVGSDV